MAAFGHTQTFNPSNAKTPVSARNISSVNRTSIFLYLDGHDFLHDQVADQLEKDRRARHLVARGVLDEELDIVAVGVEHQKRHTRRNKRQRSGRDAAVGADGFDFAAQLEPLTDD